MWNEGKRTFTSGEALAAKRRVKIKAGTTTTPPEVVYADAGEAYIGITEYAVATATLVTVKLRNYPGSIEITAAGAFSLRAALYGAADGKVDDAVSGTVQFIALEAATADGDRVEVLPFAGYHGEDDIGGDEKWYGATSGAFMHWDESLDKLIFDKADLQFGDTDFLIFGDGADVTIQWDAAKLEILPAVDDTGAFNIGDGTTDMDVQIFLGSATEYVHFDVGNSKVLFKVPIEVGVDDIGHDVKFFGATAGKYMLWDESADKLIILGTADLGTSCEADAYTVGGVAGADFGPSDITTITVVKGIVTAIA